MIGPDEQFGGESRPTAPQDNALSLERVTGIACRGMGVVWATCRRCGLNRLAASGEVRRSDPWDLRTFARCGCTGGLLCTLMVSVGWCRTGFQEVLPIRRVRTCD